MILLRHFTEDDAETIRKKQWPDLSIEEIEAIMEYYNHKESSTQSV